MKSLLFTCALLLIASCATTSGIHQFNSSEEYHKYADSVNVKFQKESFHPKRTLSYLKPVLDTLASNISIILNDSLFKSKVNFRSISFLVLPSGRFDMGYFSDYVNSNAAKTEKDPDRLAAYLTPDSALKLAITGIANQCRTDSLLNYTPKLWVVGTITDGPTGFIYNFKDTSSYFSGFTGGRSRSAIMRVVMREIHSLKEAYNEKLRRQPRLSGNITVKFAINEFGNVMYAEIVKNGTTLNDIDLSIEFTRIIKLWKFDKIAKERDVTEVIYPFTLSQQISPLGSIRARPCAGEDRAPGKKREDRRRKTIKLW